MTTAERASDLENAQLMGSGSMDFGQNRIYGFRLEEVTTGAELESAVGSLADGQSLVFFQKDAADASNYTTGYYGLGADGGVTPQKVLLADIQLAGTIADATGEDLAKYANVQQVIDFVKAYSAEMIVNTGIVAVDVVGKPTSVLPADGSIVPNRIYAGRIKAGVTVDGELYEKGGLYYFSSPDATHAAGTWDIYEFNDDLTFDGTVTETGENAVKSSAIYAFVHGITDGLSTSIQGNANRLDTIEQTTIPAIQAKDVEQDGRLTAIENENVSQGNRLTDAETKNSEQDNRLTGVENTNTTQQTSIDALEADKTAQETRMTAIETKDSQQDSRLDAVELKNTQQDNSIQDLLDKDTAQATQITQLQEKDSSQDTRISNIEAVDNAQDTKIGALEADKVVQENRMSAIETKNTTQDNRLDAVENNKLTGSAGDFSGTPSSKTGQYADIATIEARLQQLPDGTGQAAFALTLANSVATVTKASLDAVFSSYFAATVRLYHTTKKRYFGFSNVIYKDNGDLEVSFGGVYKNVAAGTVELHVVGSPL